MTAKKSLIYSPPKLTNISSWVKTPLLGCSPGTAALGSMTFTSDADCFTGSTPTVCQGGSSAEVTIPGQVCGPGTGNPDTNYMPSCRDGGNTANVYCSHGPGDVDNKGCDTGTGPTGDSGTYCSTGNVDVY